MKKKVLAIILTVCMVIALAAVGAGLYVKNTPQYALKEMIEDVQASGLEGLYPHLTSGARETVDGIFSVTESGLLGKVVGALSGSEYISALKSEIKEIQWDVKDVLKSKDRAAVILSFHYLEEFKGTIQLSMVKEDHEWKIEGINLPVLDSE